MTGLQFTLFGTALGPCGLVWSGQGVVGFQLPERSEQATLEKLAERFPAAVPAKAVGATARYIALITRLLAGKPSDLSQVKLDLAGAPGFHQRVYQVVQNIPRGNTLSYGEVAALAGSPGASRAVGQAMAKNPVALIVPCHRVTAASGKLGGFTAYGGTATKQALLALEGCAPRSLDSASQDERRYREDSPPHPEQVVAASEAEPGRVLHQIGALGSADGKNLCGDGCSVGDRSGHGRVAEGARAARDRRRSEERGYRSRSLNARGTSAGSGTSD